MELLLTFLTEKFIFFVCTERFLLFISINDCIFEEFSPKGIIFVSPFFIFGIFSSNSEISTTKSEIVTCPFLDNHVRTNEAETYDYTLRGILVNLADYNVGADKGGQVSMFDDFNLEYNKQQYLIETRISGALVLPYSAITFEEKSTHSAG